MTTGLINQGGSLSLKVQLAEFGFNHGIFILIFFLFPFPFAHSQPINVPPGPLTYRKVNPPLAVVMIALVSSFFVMGCCSVYIRRCSGRRSGGSILNPDAAVTVLGGGRRSRRAPLGLDKDVIETFPTFLYSAVKGLKIGKGSLECAVCLNEFEDGDTLRLLPQCSHVFHPDCVGEWLASHTTCPVCRANLVQKPGDVALGSVLAVEPDSPSVQENQRSNAADQTGDQVVIRVADNNTNQDRESEAALTQFSDANLLNRVQKNRPPRSWSTGWQLSRLFPRSHSTGHSLVRPGENCERFTLRLPEEVRSQLMNTHLHRAQSCVAFPRVSSSRRGYRSRSGGFGRSSHHSHYERFDHEGQPNPCGRPITAPFIARTGSIRSHKGAGGTGSVEVNATTLQRFSRSIRSPFDRLFSGTDIGSNENDEVAERLSGGPRVDSHV